MRDVTVRTQPFFLPISNPNIVTAHVKLLRNFALNQPARRAKRLPTINRRGLTSNLYLRKEVATAIGGHFRAVPPSGSNVDVETAFARDILQTAELVALP